MLHTAIARGAAEVHTATSQLARDVSARAPWAVSDAPGGPAAC
jgi:hypothetical protein